MRLAGLLSLLIAAALCVGFASGCGGGDATGGTTGGAAEAGSGEPAPGGGAPQSAEPAGGAAKACGPDSLKATGVGCGEAKAVAAKWRAAPGCAVVPGDSHASCRVRGYLCIAAAVGRGTAVSCALPGESVVFLEPR
jgi:hypothetical protein